MPAIEVDVHSHGAVGDGATLDSPAIQRAIDQAASAGWGSRVILRGGKQYLIGAINLRSGINFHLADDSRILLSSEQSHYGNSEAAMNARNAQGLQITGTGTIDGRSPMFMLKYDPVDEWWRPKQWRPRVLALRGCEGLQISDITISQAASWSLHMIGCRGVLVDRIKIRNQLDVPNCDGIDPDHCRDVEIRNCDIICGDDAIVIKTTAEFKEYGPSSNIVVKDCIIQTQDSGLKIGTETSQDIHNVRFERCEIRSGCRGVCIQLRDEGSVYDIDFRDIRFIARYHSAPWWGRGEGISLTAIPRKPETKVGTLHDIRLTNITGRSENSVRISGSRESRIHDVTLENVAVTLDRWTKYPGAVFDNRPTSIMPGIEQHDTPGISIRRADRIALDHCSVAWGAHRPDSFTHALQAEHVTDLKVTDFTGEAAHPDRDRAIVINEPRERK